MDKKIIMTTLFTLPLMAQGGESIVFAQNTNNAAQNLRPGTHKATPLTFSTTTDVSTLNTPEAPIRWGMDTAWDNIDNVTRGTNFIGKDYMKVGRVSFQPSDLVSDDMQLSEAQQEALQSRLNHIAITGVKDLIINCDHEVLNSSNYYGKPQEWYKVIKATVLYCRAKGFNVVTISPFNEPDYTAWGEGTQNHFRQIAKLINEDSSLADIRISAGNTLNCDQALSWYNYMKPYVQEGNTHQLAGAFSTYANFWKKVREDGNYATADEMHNVGEAFIGVHYGMQAGVWWGYDGAARGEYCKAAVDGKEIGYAENRDAWTAATVYKRADGRTDAFLGTSERQATASAYDLVSTDRPVYVDGYGPIYSYTQTLPGGTGYQTGQTNAERWLTVNYGTDVPMDEIAGGTWVIMNVKAKLALGYYNNVLNNGSNLAVTSYVLKPYPHQTWQVEMVDERVGGDFGYFYMRNVHTQHVADMKDWSYNPGGQAIAYAGGLGINEQWFTEYAGDGNYYIRNRQSGLYLQTRNGATSKNVNVVQAEFTGEPEQKWRFMPTDARLDLTVPDAPTDVKVSVNSASVSITWQASTATDVAGYNILRATADADDAWDVVGRLVSGNEFVDNSVSAGQTYIYKVEAVDRSRNRSEASVIVSPIKVLPTAGTLMARYDFEESLGDVTENQNNAAAYGTVTYGAKATGNAQGDNSLTLDGTSYVMLPSTIADHKSITIALWASVGNASSSWQRLFDFGNDEQQYMFLTPSNGSEMRFVMKNGGNEQILSAAKPSNGWHHFAVTVGEGSVTLYLDGEAVASTTDMTITPADIKPRRNFVGRSQYMADPLFSGSIDALRLYAGALSADDIKSLYSTGETTGISGVREASVPTEGDKIYTLDGKRAARSATGGIYVMNGKKVVK